MHSSLSSFGPVSGGAGTVVDALVAAFPAVLTPCFTYKTMVVPENGPPENGLAYGSARHLNRAAEFWSPLMPADRLMGVIPETLRIHRKSMRSNHPILSFCGVGAGDLLARQSIASPFGPLEALADSGGWVLLLGVDHSVNTSLHVAEQQAGRKQFVRWALTQDGVRACPNFPGCSNGFPDLADDLAPLGRAVQVGRAMIRAFPAGEMIAAARARFEAYPRGYLCKRVDCGRCNAMRGR